MMSEAEPVDTLAVLTRAQVTQQIDARLKGQVSDRQLSAWAFDHFYRIELEEEAAEPGYEEVLADVLDALMFAEDAAFQLDETSLRALLAQLGSRS
jgi:hypothetical protein